MTEALPTDLITGQPVEPWAMHFLDKREDVRECVARAISIPQHHTTWDLLSEPEKNLFYMQADYAISAILAAQGTEAQRARQRMRPNPIRRGQVMDEQMIARLADVLGDDLCFQLADGKGELDTSGGPAFTSVRGEIDLERLARAAHSVIAVKVAELEKALRIIAADDYDPVGDHQSFTEAAAQIARAALAPYPERR